MNFEKLYKEYLWLRKVRPAIMEEVFKTFLVLADSKSVDLDDVSFILENELEGPVDKSNLERIIGVLQSRMSFGDTAKELLNILVTKGQLKKALAVLCCELLKVGYMLFPTESGYQAVRNIHELRNREVNAHVR